MDRLLGQLAPPNPSQGAVFGPNLHRPGSLRCRTRFVAFLRRKLLADSLYLTRIGGPASRGVSVSVACAVALLCLAGGACAGGAEGDPPLSPLHHTFPSPEGLSRAVLTALADNDADTLRALALDEVEFRNAVWPDLPASRPERNVPFDYAWGDLHQKSNNAFRRLVARYGGRRYELVGVRFAGETTQYRSYKVHRETFLDLLDEEGEEVRLALFGSILERDGEFKLFSFVVD